MTDVTVIFLSLYILIMEWQNYNARKHSKLYEEHADRCLKGWTDAMERNKRLLEIIEELIK